MAIGKILSDVLKAKNTTVTDLARDINVAPTTIYSIIERDNMKIDIAILIKICKSLGVDINIFYEDYLNDSKNIISVTKTKENMLITKFNQLNDIGQTKLMERLDELLELPKYQSGKNSQQSRGRMIHKKIVAFGGNNSEEEIPEDELIERLKAIKERKKREREENK